MKIQFLTDFRGRETNEQYYTEGEVIDLPEGIAKALITTGRAKSAEVEESKPDEKIISDNHDSGRRKRNSNRK